jgi:hypothetical protein
MNTRFAFEEALNFMCQPCTSEQALGFNMSEETRERLQYLMEGRRENVLSACEHAELEAYREVALYVHMRQVQATKNAH